MKNTLRDLYLEQLQDIYSAESQLVEHLPHFAMKASDSALKQAYSDHLVETKDQLNRMVTMISRHSTIKAGGHTCKAMAGLLKEGQDALEDAGNSQVIDAHLIAASYRVEHYEIAAYQSAISMAKALNEDEEAKMLEANLSEEVAAAKLLNKIADGGLFSSGLHATAVS